MSPISIAAVVLAATCAAAKVGLLAQRLLPDHHLGSQTKDTVRLAIGTITAMTALILGLATASAKNTFDLACRNVNDAAEARLARRDGEGKSETYDPLTSAAWIEAAANRIHGLEPRDVRRCGIPATAHGRSRRCWREGRRRSTA